MSEPQCMRKNPDGTWSEAEYEPFHYGWLARVARFITRGRWPA